MVSVYTTGNSNTIENIVKNNDANFNKYSGEVGRFFSQVKSNISLDLSYSSNKSKILFNDSIITNKSNSKTVEFRFNNKNYKWATLDYVISMTLNKQKTGEEDINVTNATYLTQKADLTFYVFKNHSLGFEWSQFYTKLTSASYDHLFYDIKYQYNWIKKKINFEVKWVNITNNRQVQQVSIGPVSTVLNTMQIRPSYIMTTVKFNFK